MPSTRLVLGAGLVLALALPAAAQTTPSYARQVRPFLAKYCGECHTGPDADGELSFDSYKTLMAGGTHGPVVVPGKAEQSPLVRSVEGTAKPLMPPLKAKLFPPKEERTILRAWVDAGAKDDSGQTIVALPPIAPKSVVPPPVTALAFRPDGKLLVAGGHGEVVLIEPGKGEVVGKIAGQNGPVTALAFSRDGRTLAVASGTAGVVGEVRLYRGEPGALPAGPPRLTLAAHKDLVLDLALSPDGKTLATCGYDRLVKLWNVEDGKHLRDLTDHSDAVYGVAFRPDGTLLATVAADRAVKVWDVATGKRLYTLGEATDWLYAVAWSPDGQRLAAAGVDRSIRVWQADAAGGRLVHSVFGHEAAITRLAYAADGRRLYSLGSRTLKVWDARQMVEGQAFERQPDALLALAVAPDDQVVAVGRYDGGLVLFNAEGKKRSEPLPVKPKPPALNKLTPSAARRGTTVRLKFEGTSLEGAAVESDLPGVKIEAVPGGTATVIEVTATLPPATPAGPYPFRVRTAAGTATLPLLVDPFDAVNEVEGNDSPRTAQAVKLPVTVVGSVGRAGAIDYYRCNLKAGDEVGVQVLTAAVGSKLEPVLTLSDADGNVLAESGNGLLAFTAPKAGAYAVGIRDRDYRGDASMFYRLHMGDLPVVAGVFPLGVPQGGEADVRLEGVYLGTNRVVHVRAPREAEIGSRLPVPVTTPLGPALGNPTVVVGEFAEVTAPAKEMTLPVPGTANGRLIKAGDADVWQFTAKKGERLILEVQARRLGSPLDSTIEVLDARGKLLPRAVLRCTAKTFTTFRDHDSASSGIRIEAWSELAINDYLLVGDELMRIRELPRNPDDDCQFFAVRGQRVGYLGTTPVFHPQGEPMYKASIHPPGATFPANGLPLVTLYYRNDDGGPGFGKDSRLVFDPPADGAYQVRVSDVRGQGGPLYAYRLTVRPPRPGFSVSFNPTAPTVSKGGALPVSVSAERFDEFDGPIEVRLENLPPGLSAPTTTIPAGELSTSFALYAEPNAVVPPEAAALKLTARAVIDGNEVRREVAGGKVRVIEPGDIVTTTEQAEVTIRPGGEVRVRVRVERRNGFMGRIPLDVRGLPHGVRVLDVGLNGILVTENETERTFVLYAEPWVRPTTQPFVVLARREGKNTEHAARSVLLRVADR